MAFGPFERMVAGRYLRARRKEGFVSVIVGFSFLGIALGVATLIIVMAVMNGFREDMLSRILGLNGHIDVSAATALDAYPDLTARIKQIPGVIEAVPVVDGQVMITTGRNSGGALVRGMSAEDLKARSWISDHILEGSLDGFTAGEGVLIGTRMAERYGVRVGDEITMISPKGNVTAFGTVPRLRAYKVVALFNVGEISFDSNIVFMPLSLAQTYFQYPDQVTNIEIKVSDPDQARIIATQVAGTRQGLRVLSWEQLNSSLTTALQVERNVMFLILTLIIVVAAFNIISGLIMLVKDKSRDIAILRTMGATRGMIMRIFLLAGTTVGGVGTFLGFGLGVLFCDNIEGIRRLIERATGTELFSAEIYFLTQMPAKMDWDETLLVLAMSLALSLAATLYPSWRAARTDPVEALRYE